MTGFFATVARGFALGALFASAATALAQQDYPSKPVRLVSGYAAGGTTSLVARLIGQKLGESWGQQNLKVVVNGGLAQRDDSARCSQPVRST